jgi:O-antigen/teichoic acid export membrane protein
MSVCSVSVSLCFGLSCFSFEEQFVQILTGVESHGAAFFLFYVSTYFLTIFNLYLTTLQNFENAKAHSFFSIFHAVLLGALNVALGFALKNYSGLVYASLVSSFVVSALCTVYFRNHFRNGMSFALLKESFFYGAQSLPKSFTGFIGKFFDKYMLNNTLSLQAVGIYNIGQSLGNASFALMNAIWSSFQPLCYRSVFDQGDKASGTVGRLFSYFLFVTACPLLMFLLFSPEIVRIIAPPTYLPAVDVIVIVLCAISTNIFGMYIGVQFAYAKKPVLIFPITVVGTGVNVGLNIILVPNHGLMGASLAFLGSYFTVNALLTLIGQRLYKIKYEWGLVLSVYLIFALSAVSVIFLRAMDVSYPSQLVFKLALLGCLFVAGSHWKVATIDTLRKTINLLLSKKAENVKFGPLEQGESH